MKTRAEMEAKFGKFSDERWEAHVKRCKEISEYIEKNYEEPARLSFDELNSAEYGTRVVDKNGNVYVKGQHELPWKCGDNRYSSLFLGKMKKGGVCLLREDI